MDSGKLAIIYGDNHLLAVNKPSGMPSQPDDSGDPALDELTKDWLRVKYAKPGNVYLGLLHRLDRPTSGIVLLARTEKAASRMADKFRKREVQKTYYAVVEGAGALPDSGNAEDMLASNSSGGMAVVRGSAGGGSSASAKDKSRKASLSWKVLERFADGRGLLAIDLHTGVKHQIRVQLAWRGCPVVGDFRYGARGTVARPEAVFGGKGILLHAGEAGFVHPVSREAMKISVPPPGFWGMYLTATAGFLP